MKKPKVVAILTADWHFSHKPPVWRSNEPDWYNAMARPLDEISAMQIEHKCPVLVAGDIFDKWNSPAELINFAIKNMPEEVYAIPGQHDLPNHNIQELHRSAFASLTLTKTINFPSVEMLRPIHSLIVQCFPHGISIRPCDDKTKALKVAVVHDYVWMGKAKYPKAPEEKEISRLRKSSKNKRHLINGKYYGYDVVVYGDNHKGFQTVVGKTEIFNCGTLMRRASDEEDYRPKVGILYSNGQIDKHYLDISKDKHLTTDEMKDAKEYEEIDMELFATELRKLGASALEFKEAMKQFWRKDKTRKAVINIIMKAMEKQL
jgi:DNA repair exonuclease SbcCD nuclease subunit